jgi:GNAT superfamily N-acetyltransferase
VIVESLQRGKHNRLAFRCGTESLDRFLHEHAHQAASKGLSKTYVAVDEGGEAAILGYYSLTTCRVEPGELPEAVVKTLRLPRHQLPAVLIARLAVAVGASGQGIGTGMVVDAMTRCARVAAEIGGVAIVVDAIDLRASLFYERLGFKRVAPGSMRMFIPMASVRGVLGAIEEGRRRAGRIADRISFAPPRRGGTKKAA